MFQPKYQNTYDFKPSEPKFAFGLSSFEIDQLMHVNFKPCSCYLSAQKKYFCIDPLCHKKQLVCGQCQQNNINYDHYQHQIVYLKQFFSQKEKYIYSEQLLQNLENFLHFLNDKTNEVEQLHSQMKKDLEKLKKTIQTLKGRSRETQLKEKVQQFTNSLERKEKPKSNLQQMLKNFAFEAPNVFFNKILDFTKDFNYTQTIKKLEIQSNFGINDKSNELFNCFKYFYPSKTSSQLHINQYNEEFQYARNIKTDKFKKSSLNWASNLESFYDERSKQSLMIFKGIQNVRKLSLSFQIDDIILAKILLNFHFLEELTIVLLTKKVFQPIQQLTHKNLQILTINYSHKLEFIQQFFAHEYFPQLKKIALYPEPINIFNPQYWNLTDKQVKNLDLILKQSFDHIEYFILDLKRNSSQSLNQKILKILLTYKFKEFQVSGMNLKSGEEVEEYARKLKDSSLQRAYIPSMNLNNWKWIVYSFAKYQKEKYFSKKIFRNLALNILN